MTKSQSQITDIDFHLTVETESYNKQLSIHESKEAIQETKSAAVGPDNFHILLFKHAPENVIDNLLDIFNLIWRTDSFPKTWRMVTIVPLLKLSKNPLLLDSWNNYRPISLTSILCKILERIFNKRLMWKLETDSCISSHQCGFTAERSTQDQLLYHENNIYGSFSTGRHLLAIFFDYSKPFDIGGTKF